ncbi:hypothetical protein GJAV_G00009550 [Gymnothorax javanicus]|nr:hypothetical protein GJAV_G00009550 [Gymnothorax javanicus]
MALTLWTLLAFAVALSVCLRTGLSVPLSGLTALSSSSALHHGDSGPHRVRSKRCSCNNQQDSECHYFCHLDIMWVNTASKMTVYGLGSPLSRRRRSTGRCECTSAADRTCNSFCYNSFQDPTPVPMNRSPRSQHLPSGPKSHLLASLRSAVRTNQLMADLGVLPPERYR